MNAYVQFRVDEVSTGAVDPDGARGSRRQRAHLPEREREHHLPGDHVGFGAVGAPRLAECRCRDAGPAHARPLSARAGSGEPARAGSPGTPWPCRSPGPVAGRPSLSRAVPSFAPLLHVEYAGGSGGAGQPAAVRRRRDRTARSCSRRPRPSTGRSPTTVSRPPSSLTVTWSQVSGPGTATFADASAVDTTATFIDHGHLRAAAHRQRRSTGGVG